MKYQMSEQESVKLLLDGMLDMPTPGLPNMSALRVGMKYELSKQESVKSAFNREGRSANTWSAKYELSE